MRRLSLAASVLLGLLLLPPGAGADLLIFPEGGFLRVDAWRVEGDRIHVDLPSGGRLEMSLLRVERIVEERSAVEPVPEIPEVPLRWREGMQPPDVPWGDQIAAAAERHGLAPELVAAVVSAESAFRPGAVSSKGARGLMQLMPATAERFGLHGEEVHDPERNLDAGTRYLRWLADRFDDRLELVLAAYNAGEGTVDRYGGVPPYGETRSYLKRIYGRLGLEPPT